MTTPIRPQQTTAQRLKACRESAGISIREAARRAGVDPAQWANWESGARPIVRMGLLIRAAEAVDIKDIRVLTGEPYRIGPDGMPRHEATEAVRAALVSHPRILRPTVADLPDLAAVRADIESAWRVWQGPGPDVFSLVGWMLPDLINSAEAHYAAAPNDDTRWVANAVYLLVRAWLKQVGHLDLSMIAGQRGMVIASGTADPGVLGSAAWSWGQALAASGHAVDAMRTAHDALEHVGPAVRSTTDPALLCAGGALHLLALIAAARLESRGPDERGVAQHHVSEASRLASRLGTDRDNSWWVAFGPTNVAIHRVAYAVELGDSRRAIQGATSVVADRSPSVERRTTHWTEVAYAHARLRRTGEALGWLRRAARLCPDRVIYHPAARGAMEQIMRSDSRSQREAAAPLARRMGILI